MENFDRTSLLLSLKGLGDGNVHLKLSHLYNALSLLHITLPKGNWIGVYLYDNNEKNLVLGPFAGTPACETIPSGKGVVGTCYKEKKSIVVEDVSTFPGYICCDPLAKAEIVVPLKKNGIIKGVLDVDYPEGHSLKDEKQFYEDVAEILSTWIW